MLARLLMAVSNHSSTARRTVFKWMFDKIAAATRDVDSWTFMNLGYADLDGKTERLSLLRRDEPERYCIQLYHHATAGVDLHDKDVVEVSSGRGGGASYLRRYLSPKSVTGIDLSAHQVAFCSRVHRMPGLRFMQGDAENLALPDESTDVVVNVEASCLYGNQDHFFGEVHRILRSGGHFAFADIRLTEEVDELFDSLRRSGLQILKVEDVTENVTRALAADHHRRIENVRRYAPSFLKGPCRTFVCAQGTHIPNGLATGRMVYLSFILQKEGAREERRKVCDRRRPAAG